MKSVGLGMLLCAVCAVPAHAEKYALLIGIDDYPNVRKLKGAVNDIHSMQKVLVDDLKFPAANLQVMVNEQATKAAMMKAFESLGKTTHVGDTIFIYYSGHGWLVDDVDGDKGMFDPSEKFDEALVPYDSVPWPKARAFEPNPTLLIDDDLAPLTARLYGRRLAVIFDSCHAGRGLRGLPGEDETRSLYPDVLLPSSNLKSLTPRRPTLGLTGQVVFLGASGWKETASDMGEFEGQRHGAFTAALLRTLQATGPGWEKTSTFESLTRAVRSDLVSHGVTSQTPTLTAPPGLARMALEQFFEPLPAAEIAEITTPAAFDVYMEVNRYQFLEGEELQIAVESERDGYLYLFEINPEMKVTKLLPNRFEPDNRIFAGSLRKVPTLRDRYHFPAGKPYGVSTLVALVTREPWESLTELNLPASLSPISDAQKQGLRDGLRKMEETARGFSIEEGQEERHERTTSAEWSCQKIAVEVVPRRIEAPPIPPPKPVSTAAAAAKPPEPAAPATQPAPAKPAASSRAMSEDDSDVTWEEQQDLIHVRPALFHKLERLAERYSPTFWQDVSGEFSLRFRPWRDFFVRYDFDRTANGPNWPAPMAFQDETKRLRNRALDAWLSPSTRRNIEGVDGFPGVFQVKDESTGESVQLDLRPAVYWAALTTPTHYFFHYMCFKAEDWKPLFGHPGDLEGSTVVVDRQTGKPVALFTLAHDDVEVTRGLEDEPESNIEVMTVPSLQTRSLEPNEKERPINGVLGMEAVRDGEPAAKEHQDVYSETRGHGQYGPHHIHPSRYIIYATYLPEETWTAPSFEPTRYPVTDKLEEVQEKHKYKLIYVGSGQRPATSPEDKTLWSEYKDIKRFPGGVNPPWCWRDKLFFRTGWWRDPRTILKIGDGTYRVNPYIE